MCKCFGHEVCLDLMGTSILVMGIWRRDVLLTSLRCRLVTDLLDGKINKIIVTNLAFINHTLLKRSFTECWVP